MPLRKYLEKMIFLCFILKAAWLSPAESPAEITQSLKPCFGMIWKCDISLFESRHAVFYSKNIEKNFVSRFMSSEATLRLGKRILVITRDAS